MRKAFESYVGRRKTTPVAPNIDKEPFLDPTTK